MENETQEKSKTQIKKEAEALQKLGEQLIALPRQRLEQIPLPEDLRKAVMDARTITANVAGRRQRQYIGALMRQVDPEPIRRALDRPEAPAPAESEADRQTRDWMDRLLTGTPEALEAFLDACPELDRQRLRQLVRNINKDGGKPSKSSRTLEGFIRGVLAGS